MAIGQYVALVGINYEACSFARTRCIGIERASLTEVYRNHVTNDVFDSCLPLRGVCSGSCHEERVAFAIDPVIKSRVSVSALG